jgi:hypothetical protein
MALATGTLQQNQIQFLLKVNDEAKVRRATKSLVLGTAKVIDYVTVQGMTVLSMLDLAK